MARGVVVNVLGGQPKTLDGLSTVGDARKQLNLASGYEAAVMGESASDSTALKDNDYVTFAPAVKGGLK